MTWGVRIVLGWIALAAVVPVSCHPESAIGFPHLQHLTAVDCGGRGQPKCPTCLSCHAGAESSDAPRAPTFQRCSACHETRSARIERALQVSMASHEARVHLNFSHGDHLRQPAIAGQCFTCHSKVAASNANPGAPTMAVCLGCHQRDFDQARCTPCHRQGTLATLVPQSFMRHDPAWPQRHGTDAARAERVCEQCHGQSYCAECHDVERHLTMALRQVESDRHRAVHPSNFVNHHAIEAEARPGSCNGCHTPASCDSCHVLRGVSASRRGAANPHPIGWTGPDVSSRAFHGRAARRDISSCAACHDQGPATNCIQCHRVGGTGGSPHPRGWNSSRSRQNPPCRYCHET